VSFFSTVGDEPTNRTVDLWRRMAWRLVAGGDRWRKTAVDDGGGRRWTVAVDDRSTRHRRHTLLVMLKTKLFGFKCLKVLYLKDVDLRETFELCVNLANGGFFRHEGFVFKDKRFCVPKSSISELLVKKAHESNFSVLIVGPWVDQLVNRAFNLHIVAGFMFRRLWGVETWRTKMGESSQEWRNLSLIFRYIMDVMREFREKLDQVGKWLDLVQKDTQSANVKVEALTSLHEN
ncbi:hypothetical protein CR513_05873, partial [Mucuna pruriens]